MVEVSSYHTAPGDSLPGAIRIDPCYVEAAHQRQCYYPHYRGQSDAHLLPLPARIEALAQLGLQPQRPVLLTGTGPLAAVNMARVAWAMLEVGLSVRWLDGGTRIWPYERLPPKNGVPAPSWPIPSTCNRWTPERELEDPQFFDVRTRREYLGQQQNRYPFFSSQGHLPGAVWLGNWTGLVEPATGKLKPLPLLEKAWLGRGLNPTRPLVFYCGTGWRSSLACWVAYCLGYQEVYNYDGGVYDWVSRGLDLRF